ncbi:MAG: hypothetical protein NTW19_17605 [Planctomycetota bacterium]|nr:hypothetical protein [Planctomycetota bacterium]
MRCRTCDYCLWNLASARCPECGTDFDWRTYRFRPDTVALACPHCGHRHDMTATDPITCESCGKVVPAIHMQVVPLTTDPRQAEALPNLPVPPFKKWSAAWWMLLGLFVLELSGAAVAFLPFASHTSPLEAASSETLLVLVGVPFFLGPLVSAGALRSLIPLKWTRLEIVAGYFAAASGLGAMVALGAYGVVDLVKTPRSLERGDWLIIAAGSLPFVGVIVLSVLNWRRRVPHAILVQMSLRLAYIPNALMCCVIFGMFEDLTDNDIGWWVSLCVVAVYVIVVGVVSVLCWRRLALLNRQLKPVEATG